jgi:HPt (histidine-containing phosphotransfer) domain-containing protein
LAAKAEDRPFELVVMDIQMPVLDGFGAAALLRQDGFSGPIVALTANAMQGDRQNCLRAGFDDYCTKPVDFEQLLQVAAAHMQKHERDRSAAAAPAAGAVLVDETGEAEPLRSEFADDPDMADALAYYVDRLPRIAEELQSASARGERDELARLLHQLKGSAGSYGFPTIGEAARAAESAVRGVADTAALALALDRVAALCRAGARSGADAIAAG